MPINSINEEVNKFPKRPDTSNLIQEEIKQPIHNGEIEFIVKKKNTFL